MLRNKFYTMTSYVKYIRFLELIHQLKKTFWINKKNILILKNKTVVRISDFVLTYNGHPVIGFYDGYTFNNPFYTYETKNNKIQITTDIETFTLNLKSISIFKKNGTVSTISLNINYEESSSIEHDTVY